MTDILIVKQNESYLQVHPSDDGIKQELYEFFQFKDKNFTPNRYSKWNGMVRLYNKNNGQLPAGLLNLLLKFAKERNHTVELDPRCNIIQDISLEDATEWCESLPITDDKTSITPYDYQSYSVWVALRYQRATLLAATAAGKSLAAYLMIRAFQNAGACDDGKILIMVPNLTLITQMYSDFRNYSRTDDDWHVEQEVHCSTEDNVTYSNKNVILANWQALQRLDKGYFEQFNAVICDEGHLASADVLSKITLYCTNAYYRITMTGTLKEANVSQLQVMGLYGPVIKIVSSKELRDSGRAAKTNINIMSLRYTEDDKKKFKSYVYQYKKENKSKAAAYLAELEWLSQHPGRNNIITALAMTLEGNSLFLFERVGTHLEVVKAKLESEGHPYYVMTGENEAEEREELRQFTERNDSVTILATFGVAQTGLSIKKLHNLVLCQSSKSIVRVLQSIGRMMRLHETKDVAQIYDLVDDLRLGAFKNYGIEHAVKRFGFYQQEEHATSRKVVPVKPLTVELSSFMQD